MIKQCNIERKDDLLIIKIGETKISVKLDKTSLDTIYQILEDKN